MTRNQWTISFILLNALIRISKENEINAEIEGYDQENLQIGEPPERTVLPQDCFEVCNDYECLYLCPQPLRGVKRCITKLKSNKKNFCQNGHKESSTGNDKIKTVGKHVWQAREQFLGLKKEIESDLANRRYSLLKGLQPLSLKQYNRESLFRLGPKSSKPKCNTGQVVCSVNDRMITSPKDVLNMNVPVLGDLLVSENNAPQELCLNKEEKENERISDYNDEPGEMLSTPTIVPTLPQYIQNTREEVSKNSDSVVEGKEDMHSFIDVRDSEGILRTEGITYDTGLQKSSYYDFNSPKLKQDNDRDTLHQPSSYSTSDQTYNFKYVGNGEATTNSDRSKTIDQNDYKFDPVMYGDSFRSGPLNIENRIISQTNQNGFLLTTPIMYAISSPPLQTAENIGADFIDSKETDDSPLDESQNHVLTTPGSIEDQKREMNDNILGEPNNEFNAYTKKKSENLKWTITESHLSPEDEIHLSPSPSEMKTDVNFLLSNETGVGYEINNSNMSENNVYVERDKMEGSLDKSYDNNNYLNDDVLLNVNEASERNGPTTEINSSSGRDEFHSECTNSSLEILKSLAPANTMKQNYTSRMLQEFISLYNLTSNIRDRGINSSDCPPSDISLAHSKSPNHLAKKSPIGNFNLTNQSSDVILQNNKSYFVIDNTKHGLNSSNVIMTSYIDESKLDVDNDNEKKEKLIPLPKGREMSNKHILSNDNTEDIHYIENIPSSYKSSTNILKLLELNNGSKGPNGIKYTTSGPLETITTITYDSISKGIFGDNANALSLDNGTNRANRTITNPSYSRAQQATTTRVYFEKGPLLQNSSVINNSQLIYQPNQQEETMFLNTINKPNQELKNKMDISESKFNIERIIEEPIFNNNNITNSGPVSEMRNPDIVDQELIIVAPDFGSSKINSTDDNRSSISDIKPKISISKSIDGQFSNQTEDNNLYDQSENTLTLSNKSEIQLPERFNLGKTELKNHGIEQVYLKLEESHENSSENIENDINENELYRSYPDGMSTELNGSESYTLEGKKDDSSIIKKKLGDIINTELNSIKQQNVILKKREEEEMSLDDDPQCDCDYPISRDEEPDRDPSSGVYIDKGNTYVHPFYPMFIVVPVTYPVCDCEKMTSHNSLNNNHIDSPDAYLLREHSEPLRDYPFNSVHHNFQHDRKGMAARASSYIPNMIFQYGPWGVMYTMINPLHQEKYQQYVNDLPARGARTEEVSKLKTTDKSNPEREGLLNSNSANIEELQKESNSTLNTPETPNPRNLRNEHKKNGINEYMFVDGQYVKVMKNNEDKHDGDVGNNEERPSTVTEPSTPYTSTTALYTTEEPSQGQVINSVPSDTNLNSHGPVHYFYPSDFGPSPNNFFGYYAPPYFYPHH